MRKSRNLLALLATLALFTILPAHSQDDSSAPSLGDLARKVRLEKQQKDAPANNDAKLSPAGAESGQNQNLPGKDSQGTDLRNNDLQNGDLQSKDAQGKDSQAKDSSVKPVSARNSPASAKKVITNEELSGSSDSSQTASSGMGASKKDAPQADSEEKNPPDYWKTRILSQKNLIASLKSDIDSLAASIQFAPANCVSGCVEWNERQQQKQQQLETMKSQMEEQQKQLEEMQESARKEGYGSSVYDP